MKAGTQISTIKDNDEIYNEPSSLKGIIHLGLIYRMPVKSAIAIQTELNYVQKGDQYVYFTGFGKEQTKTRVKLNYIEMPLLIQFGNQASDSAKVKVFANIGTGVGIAIGKTQIKTDKRLNSPEGFRKNIHKDVEQRLESSIIVGTGIQGKRTSLELRYTSGLTSVFQRQSKNRYLSLSIGFLLSTIYYANQG